MSVDTHGVISIDINLDDILDWVTRTLDANARISYRRGNAGFGDVGRVDFVDGKDARSVFYCQTADVEPGTDYDDPDNRKRHTSLSLGAWGNSVNLMQKIVSGFGGWVDDSDCDEVDFYRVDRVNGENDPTYENARQLRNKITAILDDDIDPNLRFVMAKQVIKHFPEIAEIFTEPRKSEREE